MITNARIGDIIELVGYARTVYEGTVTQVHFPEKRLVTSWHNHPSKPKGEQYYIYTSTYNFNSINPPGGGPAALTHHPRRKLTVII